MSSLVYQVLWLRTLGWVFGVTVYAASTVWATFMAGLALGSLGAGVVGDRVRRPLRWFGVVELLIGVTALLSPIVLAALQRGYAVVYPDIAHSIGTLTAARVAIAFGALIVPTALMGATLPLVVRASGFGDRANDSQLSVLYGSNAVGAIAGTLTAGLFLVPTIGIQGSFIAAAIVNGLVGTVALALPMTHVVGWEHTASPESSAMVNRQRRACQRRTWATAVFVCCSRCSPCRASFPLRSKWCGFGS